MPRVKIAKHGKISMHIVAAVVARADVAGGCIEKSFSDKMKAAIVCIILVV